jgi:hypothetical protein
VIALAASQPYRNAVARGAPSTIGFSAASDLTKLKIKQIIPTRTNNPLFFIDHTSFSKEIHLIFTNYILFLSRIITFSSYLRK